MAAPANIMSVAEFIAWACDNGCTLYDDDPPIAWRLDGKRGRIRPRYLVNGKKRLALPRDDATPLNFYAVWIYRDRLGIEAEPT